MKTNNKTVRFKIIRCAALSALLFAGFLIARQTAWQGNQTLHTLMEVIATLMALMVGILALIRYYTKKTHIFLFIGSGFLGTAFLDGYHALVTSAFFNAYFPSPLSSLSPWSWVASRFFLSLLMALSGWASLLLPKQGAQGRTQLSERIVFSGMGAATLASFLFFAFYPLPRAYYPELFFGRPQDLVPGALFLTALLGYLKKGHWEEDPFEDWVVLSLIVGLMGQVLFMAFSLRLFDTMFDAAHLLKIVSYACMMQGLFISMYRLFKQVEIGKSTLEAVVESSPFGILTMSADSRIKHVNTMIEQLFGYGRSELLGQPLEILLPPRFRGRHAGFVAGFLKKPERRWMGAGSPGKVLFGLKKDGTEVPLDIGLGHGEDEDGVFILAAFADISDRMAMMEKLEQERTALKKSNLELDSFVYTASHDLRAPLRGINSFSKFIEDDYAERLDDEGRDYLRRIRNGVSRMTQMIDDLLSLSRISRQKNPYEAVNAADLIHTVTERLEFDLEEARVDLVIQSPLPVICCDRVKMSEVFLNLLNNAIKFSQKNTNGGPRVTVGYEERNGNHLFSVKDNGIGIDPKYHDKIFDIFEKLHTRENYEGTGVGLSIVKRVIDDHKGRIWIESELGKGAAFYFSIPQKIEDEALENTEGQERADT